jgi:demethylmenaquinone methyltransferase/2-methoxy-6-polyprenyl-1,4-benzoquinol methylase
MMADNLAHNLAEQLDYYRARASEYDEWWFRKGRYDHGPDLNAAWFRDITELEKALDDFGPRGKVLELAGGTGIWSAKLHGYAGQLTVVDASSEVLAVNRERLNSDRVRYIQADLFNWTSSERFDVVFFGFWLSHVPAAIFDAFWDLVRTSLAPHGRVFFVDSLKEATSTAVDHQLCDDGSSVRRLNDGRTFRVYKIYYETQALQDRLTRLGWRAAVQSTHRYFIYGSCSPGGG